MNKLSIVLLSILFLSNVHATPFHHIKNKHNKLRQHITHANVSNDTFSGIWTGQCNDETAKLDIKQNDNEFNISFIEENGNVETEQFILNKVVYNNTTSPKQSELAINYSNLIANMISLSSYELRLSASDDSPEYNSYETSEMNISMVKEGNSLRIFDSSAEESCVLTRQQ